MGESDILPEAVKRLVQTHVPTPAHLDALVAVAREHERGVTAGEVAAGKYADATLVARALVDLAQDGLLRVSGAAENPQYHPVLENEEQRQVLEDLLVAYERVPVQLVRAVYARPPAPVQSFADAFRLQRPK